MELEAENQGFRNGVHWVKRNWYNALAGTAEPDKSSIPNIYMKPNQLIEYSKEGKLKSVTEFEGGTDDKTLSTERYVWKDGRVVRKTYGNADYEVVYATNYVYDADGHEIKAETMPGPGDKLGIFAGMATTDEGTWKDGRQIALTTRDRNSRVLKSITYTYDAAGRKTREDYSPAGLYSARVFAYNAKGNLAQDTYLNKLGETEKLFKYGHDATGKPIKKVFKYYLDNKFQEETTTNTYNPQGDMISTKTLKGDRTIWAYNWEHKYDAKGNRIQIAHIKEGKPEYIEVLNLIYHQ